MLQYNEKQKSNSTATPASGNDTHVSGNIPSLGGATLMKTAFRTTRGGSYFRGNINVHGCIGAITIENGSTNLLKINLDYLIISAKYGIYLCLSVNGNPTTKTMKKITLIGLLAILLVGCFFGDEPTSYRKLTKDFWLNWWADSTDQHILLSTSEDGNGGSFVVKRTVFAVGYDNNFIIAKQHPDKQEEVQNRLFNRDSIEGTYLLSDPKDTIWLSGEDSIYKKNGKWYHISNGWNPPDSLKPYRAITYFHLVDIRHYKNGDWQSYKVYTFDNENDFTKKRKELGVSDNLRFTLNSQTLE